MDHTRNTFPAASSCTAQSGQTTGQTAVCIRATVGPVVLAAGTVPVPVLELAFRCSGGAVCTRRFLLDRRHFQRLQGFLEDFLGHPIRRLWTLDPKMLVGQQGLLPHFAGTGPGKPPHGGTDRPG